MRNRVAGADARGLAPSPQSIEVPVTVQPEEAPTAAEAPSALVGDTRREEDRVGYELRLSRPYSMAVPPNVLVAVTRTVGSVAP